MADDYGSESVMDASDETTMPEERPERNRRSKTRETSRMAFVAVFAFVLGAGVYAFVPRVMKEVRPLHHRAHAASAAASAANPDTSAPVPILWDRIDVSGMPDSVAKLLKQGKYYYDYRFPGNFGLAINYWKLALAALQGADHDAVQSMVTSAEIELDHQFSVDSADAFVLLKQGKQDLAVALLDRMRADYPDIRSRQYDWTSKQLYRRRR
ncbi:MAG TPA: hypothetical protein VMH22_07540 [bacterium]|nr:hypothetical protein [bacterium]